MWMHGCAAHGIMRCQPLLRCGHGPANKKACSLGYSYTLRIRLVSPSTSTRPSRQSVDALPAHTKQERSGGHRSRKANMRNAQRGGGHRPLSTDRCMHRAPLTPIPIIQYPICNTQYQLSKIQCPLSNTRYSISISHCPVSNARCPLSNIQYPLSDIQYPISNTRYRMPDIQYPMSNSQYPIPIIQYPIPNIQQHSSSSSSSHSSACRFDRVSEDCQLEPLKLAVQAPEIPPESRFLFWGSLGAPFGL